MSRRGIQILTGLLLATAVAPAGAFAFGPGEAAGGQQRGQRTRTSPTRADFVVLVWYRRSDPLGTFQHQVYDLRKGEYTPAVDDWIQLMRTKYPSYFLVVRSVDLSRERGKTEQLKVGSVIHRELLAAAAQSGVILGAPLRISPGPYAGQAQAPSVSRMPAVGGGDRSYLNPPSPSFPVPMPYPRPHP